jgi:hypothetical protein
VSGKNNLGSGEPTLDEVRYFITARQREILEKISECHEEIAAWQKEASQLHRELHAVPTAVVNEWIGNRYGRVAS